MACNVTSKTASVSPECKGSLTKRECTLRRVKPLAEGRHCCRDLRRRFPDFEIDDSYEPGTSTHIGLSRTTSQRTVFDKFVPYRPHDVLVSMLRDVEDEQLDLRHPEWHGVFLVQLHNDSPCRACASRQSRTSLIVISPFDSSRIRSPCSSSSLKCFMRLLRTSSCT